MNSPQILNRKLLVLCASFRLITLCMPIALASIPASINILCLVTMYAIVIQNMGRFFTANCINYLPIYSTAIVTLLFSFFRDSSFVDVLYSLFQVLIWPLVACVIVEKDDKSTAKVILIVFLLCYIITSVTTIIGCRVFPQASRQLAAGIELDQAVIDLYHSMNIGGFDFAYDIVLLLPLYTVFVKLSNKKILPLVIFVLFFWTIISTEFTTALLFAIASTILLFFPLRISYKRIALYCILFMILWLLTRELIIASKDFIINMFGSETISTRLGSLIDSFTGGNSYDDSDLMLRIDVWRLSLQSFFDSPIFGSATKGGHSYILDEIADKGLFALVALIVMYSSVRRKILSPLSNSVFYPYYVIVFAYNLIIGIVNPYNGLLIMTFIIPLHYCYFSKYEYSNEQVTPDTY